MIKPTSKRGRFILVLSGVTVLLLGTLGWFTWSDWQKISDLEDASKALKTQVAKADAEIRKIPMLEDRVIVLRQSVQNYVDILPDDAEIHAFVDKLTEFATETGVSINKLDDTAARQRRVRGRGAAAEAFERITYKLDLSGTLPALLAFIDRFENQYDRFVRIPSFRIKAFEDRMSGRQEVDPLSIVRTHEINLNLETFVYNPRTRGRGGQPVEIVNEAQKLARLRAEGEFSQAEGTTLVRYVYEPDEARRDPFVDPRIHLAQNQKVSEEDRNHQTKVLADLARRVVSLKAAYDEDEQVASIVERLRKLESNDKALSVLEGEVAQATEKKLFSIRELAQEFQTSVVKPLDALAQRRGTGRRGAAVSIQVIEQKVMAMEEALKSQAYGRVLEVHQEVKQLKELLAEPGEANQVLDRAERAVARARAYLEFERMSFVVSGFVCYADRPAQSVAIINGKSYSPGELVADDLRITAITPAEVMFDFRGVPMARRHDSL